MKSENSHRSFLGIIISIIAVILLVCSVLALFVPLGTSLSPSTLIEYGVGLFIFSIFLFGLGRLVSNSQYQTSVLRKSIEEKEKLKKDS